MIIAKKGVFAIQAPGGHDSYTVQGQDCARRHATIQPMIDTIIIILAALGVLLCYQIYTKKKSPKPMVCPLKADCSTVLKSDFSTLFGIDLIWYGFAYYSVIALSYTSTLIVPELHVPLFYNSLVAISAGAFLFSMYLTAIQAFKIKSWCSWCLTSALLSTLILICSLIKIGL